MTICTERPTNLLAALCRLHNVQGGTIHQYDLRRLQWVCDKRPNTRRNTEGHYTLVWTDSEGAEYGVGFIGGPSIEAVREYMPICPEMKALWNLYPEPRNRAACAKLGV
jgi:hypothetical protein